MKSMKSVYKVYKIYKKLNLTKKIVNKVCKNFIQNLLQSL